MSGAQFKKSSSAADKPTGSRAPQPTAHTPKVPVTTAPVDDVPVDELKVSKELQNVLRKAAGRPNLITISYISKGEQVQMWWQTRGFPDGKLVSTMDYMKEDLAQKRLGKPSTITRNLKEQLAQRKGRHPRG